MSEQSGKPVLKRIGGYLHKVAPVLDGAGKVISYVTTPVMVELKARDVMQIIVGASILAVPVAFTEETWKLGEELPLLNVLILSFISVGFIAAFVYFNFYRYMLKGNTGEYIKRVVAVYLFSLLVVGGLLTLILRCPWSTEPVLALKRMLIVAFPASMSAAISDGIK